MSTTSSYKYWGFGLHIESEIEFPELKPATFETADVKISMAAGIPDVKGIEQVTPAGLRYILNDAQLLFEVPDVARYFAQNGDTIIIDPDSGLTETRVLRLFVLATVFAGILLQREQLPLHASAILNNGELVLICGDSGAGKSTTLAGLIKNGHSVFSDDIVVVNKNISAMASYPMIKLWEDAQDKLDHDDFDDKSFVIKPGMNKYGIFFHDIFDTGSYPVKKILILKKGDVAQIRSEEVTAAAAFSELNRQVYRPVLIHNNKLQVLRFGIISALANTCKIYQVTRPVTCNVDSLVAYVEHLVYHES